MDKRRVRKLAAEHWKFTDRILAEGKAFSREFVKMVYKEALIHGYKHGYEDAKKGK